MPPEVLEDPSLWPQIITVRCKGRPAETLDWWDGIFVHQFVEDLGSTVKNELGKIYAALAHHKSVRFCHFDAKATSGEELVPLHDKPLDFSKQEDLTEVESMLDYVRE
ncbi:hypothetical protein BO79DRAFT_257921 [Aspergillus costaricaensis CBS 115574]|uniref:Uncharacterized protein n=1 Tax=Aspergillus costaricaensis CBS 115574 TaxID=1448317 RepID=A0ACD1I5D3_9EURO|nr:hypothetical protein BO79DRAFT_257921 [Aspergillus costaricaensis CBS 115574]RAK85772.1 hypothetical protein BO79DRAFT_257921 [Aspergillus costaricaensis CBS 115574]